MKCPPTCWKRAAGLLTGLVSVAAGLWLAPANGAPAAPAATNQPVRTASAAPTNAPPVPVVIPKSVFRGDVANGGRDPFYPQSVRRLPLETAAQRSESKSSPARIYSQLSLKGIVAGAGKRKLALINNRHFAAGESNVVITDDGKLVIQCLEIRESSVVIRIVNKPERHELRLRQD